MGRSQLGFPAWRRRLATRIPRVTDYTQDPPDHYLYDPLREHDDLLPHHGGRPGGVYQRNGLILHRDPLRRMGTPPTTAPDTSARPRQPPSDGGRHPPPPVPRV